MKRGFRAGHMSITTGGHLRSVFRLLPCVSVVGLLAAATAYADPQAGTGTYQFTNKTLRNGHDLHIVFSAAVQWDINDAGFTWQTPNATFKDTSGSGAATIDLVDGIGGLGVAPNANVVLTLGFPGASKPLIKRWWWTDGNGNRIGNVNYNTETIVKATLPTAVAGTGTAAGDGKIRFVQCGSTFEYQTQAGDTAAQVAADIVADLDVAYSGLVTAYVDPADSEAVVFQGACAGDFAQKSNVKVTQQDSNGTISALLQFVDPAVPATSTWGLVALLLAVMTAGTVAILRKRPIAAV